MDLAQMIRNNEVFSKRFGYYSSLGYSEKAATVLSVLTYGNRDLSGLIKELGGERILEKLYGWLLEVEGRDPQSAVSDYFARKRRTESAPRPSFLGGLIGGFSRAKSAPRGRGRAVENSGALYEECVDIEEPVVGAAAPAAAVQAAAAPVLGMALAAGSVVGGNAGAIPGMGTVGNINVTPNLEDTGALPNLAELTATDSYENIEEKDAKSPLTAPTSTFRMTTNTSSMGIILNQIRSGRSVDRSQVRIEEVLNYFDYDEEPPKEEIFKISTELAKTSGDRELLYVYVGAGGEVKEYQNIVLLLDVSGSMSSHNVHTQQAIATVVSKLKKGDRFSLITYSDSDETVFNGFKINGEGDKEDVMGRVLLLVITGCTNGSAGIETAYKIGAEHYKKNGNNQVILITDGDLNFGITKKDGLEKLIEEKKKSNLFLSVIGTGLYNYKDDKLEVLCKHGNGTYCVVNNLEDVDRSVNKRYVSLANIVAKDVKAQVEFNPRYVKSYRLLGYENRALAHEDFVNDKVISEPYGAGGHGVALYEIESCETEGGVKQELKYQSAQLTDSDELCTVKIRYKAPLSDESTELAKAVSAKEFKENSENIRLARFLYCLGEKLRNSDKLSPADEEFYDTMLKDDAYLNLPGGNGELLRLIVGYLN